MHMPDPNQEAIAGRDRLIARLRAILPPESIVTESDELAVYESDGLSAYRQSPMLVALPGDTAQVAAVMTASTR